MIQGKVNEKGQALVVIEALDRDGWLQPLEFVLDTGFTGDLLLSADVIQRLAVVPHDEINAALADGQGVKLNGWLGSVFWHNRMRSVVMAQADGEPLLGTKLLQGNRVTIDVRVDGDVVIEELGR